MASDDGVDHMTMMTMMMVIQIMTGARVQRKSFLQLAIRAS